MTAAVTAYSTETGKTYPSWDELVAAESNGWVVVGTTTRPGTVPCVTGPYATHAEAKLAQVRLRRRWLRDERTNNANPGKLSTFIRVLWKENR